MNQICTAWLLSASLLLSSGMAPDLAAPDGDQQSFVYDGADLFYDDEITQLQSDVRDFQDKTGIPLFILTSDDSMDSDNYAQDIAESYSETYYPDGSIGYVIDMDDRSYYLDFYGQEVNSQVSESFRQELLSEIADSLSDEAFYDSASGLVASLSRHWDGMQDIPVTADLPASDGGSIVIDDAQLLSEEQLQEAKAKADAIESRYGVPVFVITTYQYNQDGYANSNYAYGIARQYAARYDGNVIGFVIDRGDNTWYLYNDSRADLSETMDIAQDELDERNYGAAVLDVLDSVSAWLNIADSSFPQLAEARMNWKKTLLFAGGSGLAAALLAWLVTWLRGRKHHEKQMAQEAESYLVPAGSGFRAGPERFIRSYTTRVARPKNEGGSSGGSFSGGGGGHTGGGGHF